MLAGRKINAAELFYLSLACLSSFFKMFLDVFSFTLTCMGKKTVEMQTNAKYKSPKCNLRGCVGKTYNTLRKMLGINSAHFHIFNKDFPTSPSLVSHPVIHVVGIDTV